MEEIDFTQWTPVIHNGWQADRIQSAVNKRPCGKPAFYIKNTIKRTDKWNEIDFLTLEGDHFDISVMMIDNIPCHKCGNPVRHFDMSLTMEKIWARQGAES